MKKDKGNPAKRAAFEKEEAVRLLKLRREYRMDEALDRMKLIIQLENNKSQNL